jgi:predicted permease
MRKLFDMPRSQRDLRVSATIILLLSFGLGAATILYTALYRLLLHPLDVSHPETLVRMGEKRPPVMSWEWFPYSAYEAVRHMHSFEAVAVEGEVDAIASTTTWTEPAVAHMVSGNYFSLLGTVAERGRTLGQADEQEGAGSIPVVLSHRFWAREFGSSASVIGSTLSLQGQPFTVVGVMPQRFFGTTLDSSPDLWLPLSAQPLLSQKPLNDPEPDRHFAILGRLRSDTTLAQAQAEFTGVYRAIQRAEANTDPKEVGVIAPIEQGTFALREQFSHALTLLLCALAMLLLMVCANVAGLLLAKAVRNERDTAVRMALGASRSRLIRRALVETTILGLAGALGGLLVAYLCAPLLMDLLPAGRTPLPISLVPDWKIDLLAIGLSWVISLIFGILPAWIASRVSPQQALQRGRATRRSGTLRRALLTFQTGATLVLLVGTGLLVHTFYVLRNTSPGFDVEHLIAFALNPGVKGPSAKVSPTFPAELQQRIQSLPGVRSASFASAPLMQRIGMKTSVALSGQKIPSEAFLNTTLDSVSDSFFDTLGIQILAGRSFTTADALRSGPVPTIINEAFARRILANQNPLGKTFGTGVPGKMAVATNVVVGVAGDSKYRSLREAMLPIYYTPIGQGNDWNSEFYLYVRTQGSPASVVSAARKALSSLDSQLPFSAVITMREQLSESLWQERLLAVLAGIFSIISVLMAGTGLYGLLSYDASQRTREFGIRSAVGAQKRDVAALLLMELAHIVVPGLAAGLLACLLLVRIIASALYGIKPFDPLSLAGALLIVGAIGIMAAWQPMRRAMNVDPAIVLKEE